MIMRCESEMGSTIIQSVDSGKCDFESGNTIIHDCVKILAIIDFKIMSLINVARMFMCWPVRVSPG